jgi:hypothetical protein
MPPQNDITRQCRTGVHVYQKCRIRQGWWYSQGVELVSSADSGVATQLHTKESRLDSVQVVHLEKRRSIVYQRASQVNASYGGAGVVASHVDACHKWRVLLISKSAQRVQAKQNICLPTLLIAGQ